METNPLNQPSDGNSMEALRKQMVSATPNMPPPWKPPPQPEMPRLLHPEVEATPLIPSDAQLCAGIVVTPSDLATAMISGSLGIAKGADRETMLVKLRECVELLSQGSMEHAESMALMQAKTLECVFYELLSSAFANRGTIRFTPLLKLALKAQAQSARTLEVLGALKTPTVFTNQMNLAQQQVVNNPPLESPTAGPATKRPRVRKTVRSAQKHNPDQEHATE